MDFFQLGPIPENAITGTYYNYNLVVLSYCIAVLASYVALDLAGRLRAYDTLRKQLPWLFGGAFAMGAGIWSMHFIGMLAFIMPMPMQYNIFWTVLSMFIAILASGFALFLLSKDNRLSYMALGGVLIGLGIATMHYIGMLGMEGHVHIRYEPGLFFLSILIAIVATEMALWLALRLSKDHFKKYRLLVKMMGALVMGAAICGMHYTGMAAAVFTPAASAAHNLSIPQTRLAFYVAATTLMILAVALLASTYKRILFAIQNEKDFLNAILHNLEDGIIACDAKGEIILLNRAMQKMSHCGPENPPNDWIKGCELYHPNSHIPLQPEERPLYLALQGKHLHALELVLTTRFGVKHDVIIDGQPITNLDDEIVGAVIAIHDITEHKKMQYQLLVQATHDMLTGLPNRVLLIDRIGQAIKECRRNDTLLAILFLDVDRFKSINDRFGHASGDGLLLIIAKRLARCIREGDTVARLGGDEFVVLLNSLKSEEAVIAIAQKILHKMGEPFDISDHPTQVTASIGVSLYPKNGDNADILLQKADAAMYRVKAHNRNHVRFYSEDMNVRTIKRNELEQYLYEAIDNQQFIIYYQPIIDMQKGYIIACEALLRWQHPTLGLLMPADFLPFTEETGQIVKIGEWVLNTACAQNKAWQDQGLSPIRIAVNVSSLQFMEEDFFATVENALKTSKMDPHHLELELTESMILQQPEQALEILRQLKEIGVNIALDDFGTGYSSLGYLSRLPVSKIKIDRSFVHDIAQHSENAAIVLAIIKMASSMKLKVTAEGMETESELAFLRFNRCDEVQGYYFSKPLPVDEVTALLKEKTQYDLS